MREFPAAEVRHDHIGHDRGNGAALAFEYRELRKAGGSSEVETYEGTRRYKTILHHTIWRGTAVLAVAIVVLGFLMGGIG